MRDVRKNHMQKIEFGTGVMFGKKHGQVTSSVSKMLVGPQKRIRISACSHIQSKSIFWIFDVFLGILTTQFTEPVQL